MAKREENLAKNTVLFAIGNLGSKLLQIVLVPFYTRFMSDTQYGTVDLLQSMASLLMPIFSLTIAEGVFRYAMDKDYDKSTVLSVGIVVTAIGSMILCFGGWGVSCSMDVTLVWLVVAKTITQFHNQENRGEQIGQRITQHIASHAPIQLCNEKDIEQQNTGRH